MHEMCYLVLWGTFHARREPRDYIDDEDLLRFGKATRLLYHNPQELEGRMTRHVNQQGLSSRNAKILRMFHEDAFQPKLFARFPYELQVMIVDLIRHCWYLTVIGENRQWFKRWQESKSWRQPAVIGLKSYIWVYKISYRGSFYVSRLSDGLLNLPGQFREVCMKLSNELRQVVLSMDHVGIRKIQLVTQGSKPLSDGSPWYKSIGCLGVKVGYHSGFWSKSWARRYLLGNSPNL